jgi:hypothetical protein
MHLKISTGKFLLICLAAGVTFFSGCKTDEEFLKPKLSPEYALPLVYGDLTINNLTKDSSLISTDPNQGYLRVITRDTLESEDLKLGKQLVKMTNFSFPTLLNVTAAGGGNVTLPTQNAQFDVFPFVLLSKLTETNVNVGTIGLKVQNSTGIDLTGLVMRVPGATRNGVEFSTGPFDVLAGQEVTRVGDLAGYTLDLRGLNGDSVSLMGVVIESDGDVGPQNGGSVQLDLSMNGVDLERSKGRFFSIAVPPTSTEVELPNFYQKIQSGSFNIQDAEIRLGFHNTMGIPYDLDLDLQTVNGFNGNIASLSPPVITLQPATDNYPNGVQPRITLDTLDDGDGLGPFISNFPSSLKVSVGIGDNVDPNSLDYFMYKDSELKLYVEAEIPFAVKFNALTFRDVKPFEFLSELSDKIDTSIAVIDTGTFTFHMKNGFPYTLKFKITAVNGLNDSVALLLPFSTIQGATVDPVTGRVDQNQLASSSFSVGISQDLINKLKNAKSLEIIAVVDTDPLSTTINRIYSDYKMSFKVDARLKVFADPLKEKE